MSQPDRGRRGRRGGRRGGRSRSPSSTSSNGHQNFGGRPNFTPRGNSQGSSRGRPQFQPGDWICSGCACNNFASRQDCYRCQAPKNPNQGSPQGFQGGNHSRRNSQGQGRPPPQPGDWVCGQCNYNNFASRRECKRCNTPNQGGSSGSQNNQADWICKKCQKMNPGSRIKCINCQVHKSWQIGDWLCPKCGHTNRANNKDCYNCIKKQGGGNGRGGGAVSLDPTQGDVKTLLSCLQNARGKHTQVEQQIKRSDAIWRSAWQQSNQLLDKQLLTLIVSLTELPSSCQFEPPPLNDLEQTAKIFLRNLDYFPKDDALPSEKISRVDIIFRFVKRLQDVQWDQGNNEAVRDCLKEILSAANSRLELRYPEHSNAMRKILDLTEELGKFWSIKIKASVKNISDIATVEGVSEKTSSWQNVTIGWLTNTKLFNPLSLPRMKVPGSESGGVYNSSDEYFDTIQSNWIGMTFGDGNAAISPKCRWRTADKECGQVLWPLGDKGSGSVSCRTKGRDRKCPYPAIACCQNRIHHEGLCAKCFNRIQAELMGPTGPQASTHIYDCRVTRVDYEGKIFIQDVTSRRPPQQAIHWRTTKRLSATNLVAMIKLTTHGCALRKEDPIIWGEIVNHSNADSRDEANKRANGQIAVSLSSISNTNAHDILQKGDFLAVIDCMTFVPEFIPVLKALDIQRLSPLPFKEGFLLNITRTAGQNVQNDYYENESAADRMNAYDSDSGSSGISIQYTGSIAMTNNNVYAQIDAMVDESELDPIIQIRRDERSRDHLVQDLTSLVQRTTLDKEQFESFLSSLKLQVNLTQGPPGTGKSYLGVVIVRALLIIRKLWMRLRPEVGQPPILVLSYKNHAIDEFLIDIINAEGRSVSLIRIGGSCKDPQLAPFSEQNQRSYRQEMDASKNKLRFLHNSRQDYLNRKKQLSPLLKFRGMQCDPNPPKDDDEKKSRANSAIDATVFISCMIAQTKEIQKFLEDDEESLYEKWDELFNYDPKTETFDTNLIGNLMEGVRHYDLSNGYEVLHRWILGFRPLPKCNYSLECTGIAQDSVAGLCPKHQCQCYFSNTNHCPNPILEGHKFCVDHACQAKDCGYIKPWPEQRFCEGHACFVCVQKKMIAEIATDDPPRNACGNHSLCCALQCLELALPETSYCEEHKQIKCAAVAKNGERCNKFVKSRDNKFCENHQPQVVKPKPIQNLMPGKCNSKTSKGRPCRAKPMQGFAFCQDHAHKQPKKIATPQMESGWEMPDVELVNETREQTKIEAEPKKVAVEPMEVDDKVDGKSDNEESDFEVLEPEEDLPDEDLDKQNFDNPDEIEESDNIQHLREVLALDDEDKDLPPEEFENEVESSKSEEDSNQNHSKSEKPSVHPESWTWEMTLEERWNQCQFLEEKFWDQMSNCDEILKKELEVARREYHEAKVRASLKVYEQKAVIGGTIVGCITRLEAIRATNPFAILVEEASEVLEPLLFSCFCPSTCKLQLIGDHLQLKPSIMAKFQFEVVNKVNISMFERLIRAPEGHKVPSTALSTQRRMRKNICDLTRDFYKNIVQISDAEICHKRKIDGGIQNLSRGEGREVPGILPHVFFWTHKGIQSKASVGLSRVNQVECDMAVSLAKYLVTCGVPKPSIAILTPYKGQLMLIRGELIKMGLLQKFPDSHSCILSTVDRFQGDEADVIIISLVIDAKSQTPFVKQENRMIVLLSRARLGMFILGNIGYFEGKPDPAMSHWEKTLTSLRKPAEQDTDPDSIDEDLDDLEYLGPRLGPELPICCPMHKEKQVAVTSAKDLKLGFCDVLCREPLSCSHECGLPCHYPQMDSHRLTCPVKIDSPCNRHPDELTCEDIFNNARPRLGMASQFGFGIRNIRRSLLSTGASSVSISQALKHYQCTVIVSLQLPCIHVITKPCHEESEIVSGIKPYPRCDKKAHTPYIYPDCLHELPCLCHQLQEFKKNPSVVKPCIQKVLYIPSCTHSLEVDCSLKQKYEKKVQHFVCPKMLDVKLPRCGHTAKVPCDTAIRLQAWVGVPATTSASGGSKGGFWSSLGTLHSTIFKKNIDSISSVLIRQGQTYGPKDHICKKEVIFERTCGHQEKLPCEQAFDLAPQRSICSVEVEITNPECGHPARLPCHQKQSLLLNPKMTRTLPMVVTVVQGNSKHQFLPSVLNTACTATVTLERTCGHKEEVQCCQSRDGYIIACDANVVLVNPICGHDIEVPCQAVPLVKAYKPWPKGKDCSHYIIKGVLEDNSPTPEFIPTDLKGILKPCPYKMKVNRTMTCRHVYETNCKVAINLLVTGKPSHPKCEVEIPNYRLKCGHTKTMKCWEDLNKFQCKEEIEKPCWNYPACGKLLTTPCSNRGLNLSCDLLTTWTCPNDHSFDSIPQCQKGIPKECPECNLEEVYHYGATVQGDILANISLPTELESMNVRTVPWKKNVENFLESQAGVVHNFSFWLKTQDPMRRPLFDPKKVLCFIPLKYDQRNEIEFSPRTFKKAHTLHGIEVFEWTTNNLKMMLMEAHSQPNQQIVLLLGIAFCCNVLVNPSDIPNKKKKHWEKEAWVETQTRRGFDSVQYSKGGLDVLVIWDPYPLIATHKIHLRFSDLELLAEHVNKTKQLLNPKLVEFKIPVVTTKSSTMTGNSASSTAPEQELKVDGLMLQCPWDSMSLGRPTSLKLELQNDLRSKLTFCWKGDNAPNESGDPFAGINLVEKLLKQNPNTPELHLLKSLELLELEDAEQAKASLDAYKTLVKQMSTMGHPLYLLAFARMAKKTKPDDERKFLKMFSIYYPDAVKNWFDKSEKSIIKGNSASKDQGPAGQSENDLKTRWKKVKNEAGINSEAMEKLLQMTGLKKVKNFSIDIFESAIQFNKLSDKAKAANMRSFNYCFLGNAGTGKTTVARHIAGILKDSGVRSSDTFVETSAQKLKDMGSDKFRELAQTAIGGVLFIDEAYDLDPKGDFKGKPIVSELLVLAENDRDKLSIILAGYEDDMNAKFFSYNEGLKSRFDLVNFDDFDEEELRVIWDGEVKQREFSCDDRVSKVVSQRLAKASGKKGFGNARAVRKEAENAIKKAMTRKDHNMIIDIHDVMGETPLDNPKLKAIVDEINGKIGWKSVKEAINELIQICDTNYKRELLGQEKLPVLLNRLFLGNPGTGKTTCAKLYGKLLKQLNFLSDGQVVTASASDFVGSVVGESQQKTNAMLEKARGKVLLIDEAYNLDDNLYGKQVLDVLVEKIQNPETDDCAVLLLGYEPQIRKMLRDQNPGLARRFPVEYAFVFEDYTDKELLLILKQTCTMKNYHLENYKVGQKFIEILSKQRLQPNFGNVGSLNSLIQAALSKAAKRPISADGSTEICLSDLEENVAEKKSSDPMAPLDKLYRVDKIKKQLIELSNAFKVAEAEGTEKPDLGHFVFRGAPGTGKTTVARVMAQILSDLGILARNHVEETSGLDLTGEFVGQTKKKVEERLNCARGGILFIDEAYELGKGQYGTEAMTTLVAAMTDPTYKGMAIIIAGYPQDMELMLARNVGLKSRFQRFFDFENWKSEDCIQFFELLAKKENFVVESEAKYFMPNAFDQLISFPGWGNARDTIAAWKLICNQRANRVVKNPEDVKTICKEDVEKALTKMIEDRKPKVSSEELNQQRAIEEALQALMPQGMLKDMSMDAPVHNQRVYERARIEEIIDDDDDNDEGEPEGPIATKRDPGVSDEIWLQLEMAKAEEMMEQERIRQEQEEAKRLAEEKRLELIALQERMEREAEEERKRELQQQLEQARERERQRLEKERMKREKEEQERPKAEAIKERLRQIGPCPAGFNWTQLSGGWRCGGGSHFVSDAQLRSQFGFDV